MRRIMMLSLGMVVGTAIGWGQVSDRTSILDRAMDQRALQSLIGREASPDQVRGLPMEGVIDPQRYQLGPSDLLFVGLWGPITTSYSLTVTPEGSLIIPTIGEVAVANVRLADAKIQIAKLAKRRYPSSEVTVALLRPRSFIVSLRGNVTKPGQYVATGVDRVEKIIAEGSEVVYPTSTYAIPALKSPEGTPTDLTSLQPPIITRPERFPEETSTRNIQLIRKNGDTIRVDLLMYQVTGDDRFNPFLLDGDIIHIPNRNRARNYVTVNGAVNSQGMFEFVEGDRLTDVIGIAGGLLGTADPSSIVVSRVGPDGRLMMELPVNWPEIQSGLSEDPLLQRGDRIVVKEHPSSYRRYEVTLVGEIRSPGVYPISAWDTRLSKILRDAGGLTERALPSGSVILRRYATVRSDKNAELPEDWELLRSLRTHQLNFVDSTLFLLGLRVGRQPVVMDFKKLIMEGDSSHDVMLQKDDIIYVASDQHTVLVQVQVASAGYVPYVPGADYRHYIRMAGGFSELAEEDEVRIVKRGTMEWVEPDKTSIESGDQIWVPKEYRREFLYYFSIVRDVAATIGAIGTVIILAIQVSK